MKNFEFKWHGMNLWYSRSVACQLTVFAMDREGNWNVLAKRRELKSNKIKWNVPFAYLEFDQSGELCAVSETYDETGIIVPKKEIKLMSVNTNPTNHKQNVILKYYAVLKSRIEDDGYAVTKDDAMWIPIKALDSYTWSFRQDRDIENNFRQAVPDA